MRKTILSTLAASVLLLGAATVPAQAFSFKEGFHKGTAASAKVAHAAIHVAKVPVHLVVDTSKRVLADTYGLIDDVDSLL